MKGEKLEEGEGFRALGLEVEPLCEGNGERNLGGIADGAEGDHGDVSVEVSAVEGGGFPVDRGGTGGGGEGRFFGEGFGGEGLAEERAEVEPGFVAEERAGIFEESGGGEVGGEEEITAGEFGVETTGEACADEELGFLESEEGGDGVGGGDGADAGLGEDDGEPRSGADLEVERGGAERVEGLESAAEFAAFLREGEGDDDHQRCGIRVERMGMGGWVGMNDDDLFIEKKMGGQGGGVSLWLGKFIVYRVMPFDRRILIVALVCSLGVLGMGTNSFGQAPGALPLDEQAKLKGDQLISEGKYAEAAAAYEDIVKKFPGSTLYSEANLRAGSAYFSAGNYDAAAAIFAKLLEEKRTPPELALIVLSMQPQVTLARANGLKDKARTDALNEALKQFDQFLAKSPKAEEFESASYGKAQALYQLEEYPKAVRILQENLTRFPNSLSIQESKYLLAVTVATVARNTMRAVDAAIKKNADPQFDEAEKMLKEIIGKRQNLAMVNDANFQLGEVLFSRASGLENKEKQVAMFGRAIEAYRSTYDKAALIQLQQQYVESIIKARTAAGPDRELAQRYGRMLEKEQQKLGEYKTRSDQSLAARIRMAQIFSQLGKNDETRAVMNYLDQTGLVTDVDQKKFILYYTARSYAAQKIVAKAVEKYDAFQAAYKGDEIAQDLPLLMGAMYLGDDPKVSDGAKAEKYFEEARQLYPNSKAGSFAVLLQAQAMMQRKEFEEAIKLLDGAIANHPTKALELEAQFFRATALSRSGKKVEAMAAFKKVRDGFSGTPQAEQAHYQIGQILGGTDAKAAMVELQGFITKFPNSAMIAAATFELGKAQAASGQSDLAVATFKTIAEKYPKSPVTPYTYFERANLLNKSQKMEECLAVMKEYTTIYADNVALLYQAYDFMGKVYGAQSRTADAAGAYADFVAKYPKEELSAEALLKQSDLWKAYAEGQGPYLAIDETKRVEWRKGVEKGTATAEKVLADFPESPAVALALKNLLGMERLQQSVKLKTAAEVDQYFTELALKFADKPGTKSKIIFTHAAYNFEKNKVKATEQMRGAYRSELKFAPEDLDLYGQALIESKELDDAIKVYEKLAVDYPLPPGGAGARDIQEAQAIALAGLGKAMQEKGDKEGGAKKFAELERLYSWSPKMLEVNYGIAVDLQDKKQSEEAIKRLITVIKAPRAPAELRAKSMLLLGRIYEGNQRYSEAIDNYVKISVFYSAVQGMAAEGLWRGAQLLERQAKGEIPAPGQEPAAKVEPKAEATPKSNPPPAAKKAGVPPVKK